MIQFNQQICSDFATAIQKEWLETNGIGGYASSTIIGANTRRYHGLLIAATQPPVGRRVLLSKLEETLFIGDTPYEIACNQYPDVLHPQGYRFLQTFKLDPFPTWRYEIEGVVLEKSLWMGHGENRTVLTYTVREGAESVRLYLRPLVAGRDRHSLHYENPGINTQVTSVDSNTIWISPYGPFSRLYLQCASGEFKSDAGYWYKNFEYPVETARGFDDHEDLYSPGYFSCALNLGESVAVIASTQAPNDEWEAGRSAEINRRARIQSLVSAETHHSVTPRTAGDSAVGESDEFLESLFLAADEFLIQRNEGRCSIIAGYHWFTDWGRDAMIALPGLTLVTGRHEIAKGNPARIYPA